MITVTGGSKQPCTNIRIVTEPEPLLFGRSRCEDVTDRSVTLRICIKVRPGSGSVTNFFKFWIRIKMIRIRNTDTYRSFLTEIGSHFYMFTFLVTNFNVQNKDIDTKN